MRALALALALVVSAAAVAADKEMLLTGNGLANEKFSQYKKAPTVKLENAGYYAVPAMLSETGTAKKLIPFTEGILTNGDSTSSWKRKPGPYTYWTGKKTGELFFHFGRPCRITRVRVGVLFSESSAIRLISLFGPDDPAGEKDPPLLGKIEPAKTTWYEIRDLTITTDRLRLLFEGAGKTYMHVTEIEVWGAPVAEVGK